MCGYTTWLPAGKAGFNGARLAEQWIRAFGGAARVCLCGATCSGVTLVFLAWTLPVAQRGASAAGMPVPLQDVCGEDCGQAQVRGVVEDSTGQHQHPVWQSRENSVHVCVYVALPKRQQQHLCNGHFWCVLSPWPWPHSCCCGGQLLAYALSQPAEWLSLFPRALFFPTTAAGAP
jgi:hypothetical protein